MLLMNLKLQDLKTAYITYQLRDTNGIVQYIGCCRLNRISELPDAFRHPMFTQFFSPDRPISVEGLFISNDRKECHAKRVEIINLSNPRPNLNIGSDIKGQHGVPIICNETGEIFSSLKDVVKAHKCTLSALSNHLQGKEKYKTVGKKTYQRGPFKLSIQGIFN